MNIAEGKGRQTTKEFIQFLYIARGSLFEVVTLLIILERVGWITKEKVLDFQVWQKAKISQSANELITRKLRMFPLIHPLKILVILLSCQEKRFDPISILYHFRS